MPVNTQVADSLISAFQAGYGIRRQKTKDIEEAAEKVRLEKEQTRQFNEKLAQDKEQFEARQKFEQSVRDIQNLIVQNEFGKQFSETGNMPAGAKIYGYEVNPEAPDIDARAVIEHPVLGKMTPLLPEASSRLKAQKTAIEQEPLQKRAEELEKLKQAGEERIKNLELSAKEAESKKEWENRIKVAGIQAGATLGAAKTRSDATIRAAEIRRGALLDRPIDLRDQRDVLGLKQVVPGLTMKEAAGMNLIKPLSEQQQNKLADFTDLETQIEKLKPILEYKDPATGKTNYEGYFAGKGAGFVKEIKTGFRSDEGTEAIRRDLAGIQAAAKNIIGKYGGALTANEQKMLEALAPGPNFSLTPDRAKALVDGFLEQVKDLRREYMKGSTPSSGTGDAVLDLINKHRNLEPK